jgi:arylsulfatase A-like enzyme
VSGIHKLFTGFALVLFGWLMPIAARAELPARGNASHVVVVVWDGMRPDFVTEQNCPTLFRLARQGVFFKNHHPVYISTTEVNGTALATGMYPQESGIIGNSEFRPVINAKQRVRTEALGTVRKGDECANNHYLNFPTIEELLHLQGKRTVIAGAKPVVLLHDRAERENDSENAVLCAGRTLPENLARELIQKLGEFPATNVIGIDRDRWTTKALIDVLWAKNVPAFSLLWLSEPDFSQHETGPGSPESLKAIRSSDDNLALALQALEKKGVRDQTDVIVVSDHAFSTISQNIDVAGALKAHGFNAFREFPPGEIPDDALLVIGNGGSAFIYLHHRDHKLVTKLAHFLQSQPFAGVIFCREPVEGTFSLADAKINSPDAADIVLSLHWTDGKNANGVQGLVGSDYYEYGPPQGMHGTLSPFDMHNTCIAAGPDFRKGVQDYLPSGNIDIAPTVAWILGVELSHKFSGRVLKEALAQAGSMSASYEPRHLEGSYRGDGFVWKQYLNFSEVNGVVYFDEGNGNITTNAGAGAVRASGSSLEKETGGTKVSASH